MSSVKIVPAVSSSSKISSSTWKKRLKNPSDFSSSSSAKSSASSSVSDFSDADVSCDYVITFQTLNSNVTDLIVTSYTAPDGTPITVSDASTRNNVDIHGTYNYGNTATTNLVQNYRINVMWNDNPTTESMNNTQDTNATVPTNTTDEYATTKMNVQIAFTQKVS